MTDNELPPPEEIILYEKDPATKIATITFNRPELLNAPTIGARLRYAHCLDLANIDDDVKVLVIRGAGDNLGSGADLPELNDLMEEGPHASLREEFSLHDEDVSYPPPRSYRARSSLSQWYADPRGGCRTLADFKKISIVEAKGYCYGWHFYQTADADLVIASDDALFGHPAFRYVGWGPRMWSWAMTMGIRKFQEMVFTGRPFTAEEMAECNFVNSVVPRAELEAEVAKYANACARSRPTDAVVMQKEFFKMMKQHQGEYMGSILSSFLESLGGQVKPDGEDLMLGAETYNAGLGNAVKNNDANYPPEWRLSKSGRAKAE
jgi:enoyl-CoA hydratase